MIEPIENNGSVVNRSSFDEDARNLKHWRVPNEPSPVESDLSFEGGEGEGEEEERKLTNSHSRSTSTSSLLTKLSKAPTTIVRYRDEPKVIFQDRLWKYLFTNVNRAVDELYFLCEEDSDADRANEAVQLLNRSKIDFEKLVERIALQAKFEQDPVRGVEWEVRKTNVGKPPVILNEHTDDDDDDNNNTMGASDAPHRTDDSSPTPRRPLSLSLKLLEIDVTTPAEGSRSLEALPEDSSMDFRDLSSGMEHHRHASSTSSLMSALSGDDDDVVRFEEASDAIWAQAEAYVEAQAQAEEAAWLQLEIDMQLRAQENSSTETKTEISREDGQLPRVRAVGERPSVPRIVPYSPNSTGSLLSPASSISSAAPKTLHEKLMSPDRRKLTPVETKKRHEERLQAAEQNREKYEHERIEKARQVTSRAKDVELRKAQRQAQAEQTITEKLMLAEKRHDDHIRAIRGKAGNENIKVNEVLFINTLNAEVVQMNVQEQLDELEARIQAGRIRRQQRLIGISASQRGRRQRTAQQMSERQLEQEQKNMTRWNKLSARIEAVQERREKRLGELARQRETLLQQQLSVRDRRDALQQEMVSKAQVREQRRQEAAARRALKVLSPTVSANTTEVVDAHPEPVPSRQSDSSKPLDDDANIDDYLGRILQRQPADKLTKLWKQALVLSGQAMSRKVAKKARESCLEQQSTITPPSTEASSSQDNKLHSRIAELEALLARSSVEATNEAKTAPDKTPKKPRHKKKASAASLADQGIDRAAFCRTTAVLLQNIDSLTPANAARCIKHQDLLNMFVHLFEPSEQLTEVVESGICLQLFKSINKLVHQAAVRDALINHRCSLAIVNAFIAFSSFSKLWWADWLFSIETQEHSQPKTPKSQAKALDNLPTHLECFSELISVLCLLVRHLPSDGCVAYQEFVWYLFAMGVVQGMLDMLRNAHEHTPRLLENPLLSKLFGRTYALLDATSTVLASHTHQPGAMVASLQQLRGRACTFPRAAEIFSMMKDCTSTSHVLSSVTSLLMYDNPRKHSDELRINPQAIELATIALRTLNNIAMTDLRIAQDLTVEDVQITLYHMVERILAVIVPTLEDQSSTSVQAEECLRQLIVYLGYLCLCQPTIQQRMSYGRPPTVLMRLCGLPMRFFSHVNDKAVLLPTLIAMAFMNDDNKRIIHNEMSPALLVGYVERHLHILDDVTLNNLPLPAETRALSLRLPSSMWRDVIAYLQQPLGASM